MILRLFSRRWILATLLVVAAGGVMVRLGIWQLDRLEQRRAFNARVTAQLEAEPLKLSGENLQADLYNMEYRQVVVEGEYDHARQIAIRNQAYEGQWGVHLITPLKIAGSDRVILVDRGWIPAEDFQSGDWSAYDEPGRVTVTGMVRRSQEKADFGRRTDPTPAPGDPPLKNWNFVNVDGIERQMPYALLPAYVQQAPEAGRAPDALPVRELPELEITEGPHLGYAFQWFTFAALLVIGYPFFVHRQEKAGPAQDAAKSTGQPEPEAEIRNNQRVENPKWS